jgi:hypothetical protein
VLQYSIGAGRPASPPIQVARWARNGKHPNALLESMKADEVNSAAIFRTKEVFRTFGNCGQFGAGSGTRWRCAFHTGPYTQYLDVEVSLIQNSGFSASSYGQVDITPGDGSAVLTDTFPTGVATNTLIIDRIRPLSRRFYVKPDMDYTVVFSDHGSNMCAANIRELASLTAFVGGYLPQNIAATGPILAGYRKNAAEIARNLWRRGGAQLLNWCNEDGTNLPATTSTTYTNLVEATVSAGVTTLGSSSVTPNTLGYILDTTYRARRSQQATGVPVRFCACMFVNSAGADGAVRLVNSAGTVVASLTSQWTLAGGVAWATGTATLPIGLDKYDLQFAAVVGGTQVSCYAVSIYEYEP